MDLTWVAVYQDGTVVNQHEKGKENSTARLSRKGLAAFALINRLGRAVLVQHFDDKDRFIYRRRSCINSVNNKTDVCHLVGRQKLVEDQIIQNISYVFEADERVESAGEWRADHPWFYEIVLEDFDKITIEH